MNQDLSILTLILHAGFVVQGVLVLLMMLSLVSWMIIFNKWKLYRKTRNDAEAFSHTFWPGTDMDTVLAGIPQQYPDSPLPNIFQAGYREFMRTRREASQSQSGKLLPLVAWTVSAARLMPPFRVKWRSSTAILHFWPRSAPPPRLSACSVQSGASLMPFRVSP